MTDEQRNHWQALASKATHGPWEIGQRNAEITEIRSMHPAGSIVGFVYNQPNGASNAAFIAASHEVVPQLLEENKALGEILAKSRRDHSTEVACQKTTSDVAVCTCGADKWNEEVRRVLVPEPLFRRVR